MSTLKIDLLFAQALSGNYEDDHAWEAVHELRSIGTRDVFERAVELCKSSDPLSRARGAEVLAQVGKTARHPSNGFANESYAVVTELVRRETEPMPLAAAIAALGHIDNSLAVPLIASFASHSSGAVRFDVAFALGCFPNEPISVETLLRLMEDPCEDVRDWATFGLGVLGDADSEAIRESLVRRLDDSNDDVREEAMVSLGKRRDPRMLSILVTALEESKVSDRLIESACLMLGMENEQHGWKGSDYAAALRERFTL